MSAPPGVFAARSSAASVSAGAVTMMVRSPSAGSAWARVGGRVGGRVMASASRGAARVTGLCIDNPSLECRREPARADARPAGQADSGKGWWSGARREGRGDARRIAEQGGRGGDRLGPRQRFGQRGSVWNDRRDRERAPRAMLVLRRVMVASALDRDGQRGAGGI